MDIRTLVLLAAACSGAGAAQAGGAPEAIKDTRDTAFGDSGLFGSHEENYVLLANKMRNNGWADDDERAMRAHYSLRYTFFGRKLRDCPAGRVVCTTIEAFLAYTGEFDFYLNTRPSGPVINRLSNPGLHVRWRPASVFDASNEDDFLSASVEHASDGQVREVTSDADAAEAERNYLERRRPFFDEISRGSDFVTLGARLGHLADGQPLTVNAKVRAYLRQDSAVTWGPLAGRGVRLSDYHRLSTSAEYDFGRWGAVELRWTVGDKGLATDSFDLGWRVPLAIGSAVRLPLYLRAHRGPLNTLSNYTQRQDSVGIGLRFADF